MTQPAALNDTAIVIVTFNSSLEIGPCLEAAANKTAQVIVVDNASEDNTVAIARGFPVQVIANSVNRGFAGAVNQGVRASDANFILLLNPDAVLEGGIEPLRALCLRQNTAAAAGLLVDHSGLPQAGFTVRRLPNPISLVFEVLGINRAFPRNPINWRFRCFDVSFESENPVQVEQPAGAFFFFRRADWEELNGYDEQFHPLWFEDVDFCARLKQRNRLVFLVPKVRAKHTGSHSILNMAREIRQIYWYGNLLRYASKHFSSLSRNLVCISVLATAGIRYLGDVLIGQKRRRQAGVWKKVARLAVRCFAGAPI